MAARARWIFAGWLALLPCGTAGATAVDCGTAIKLYNYSVDHAFEALRAYARCIETSQGQDACILAFAPVESARAQYELSVRDYRMWCR